VRAWIDEQATWEAKDTQRAKYRKKPAA
jgi:hypothetical protein